MKDIRPCEAKSHEALAKEWDRLAVERHRQVQSGDDLSFHHVIAPTALDLLRGSDTSRVLDIGCGTGVFTSMLAAVAADVIAMDPSKTSISIARQFCKDARNVTFVEKSLEDRGRAIGEAPATAAVAVMTLMTTPDLMVFARSLRDALGHNAMFVATMTHPWFWPRYWGYQDAPWFRYSVETFIEAPFSISKSRTDLMTTHVHRPLERYVSVFEREGFRLSALVEPLPLADVEALYPARWLYPRFLGIRWQKTG